MMHSKPSYWFGLQLCLGAACHRIEHKLAKEILIAIVILFGALAGRSILLVHDTYGFVVPSLIAIGHRDPATPLLLMLWSMVVLLLAGFLVQKKIAFKAALQLYNRFGIELCP